MTDIANTQRIANLRTFFVADVVPFGIVRNGTTEYCHIGSYEYTDGVETHVRLLNMSGGNYSTFGVNDRPSEDWEIVYENDEPKVMPTWARAAVRERLAATTEARQLRERIQRMESDWETLNENLISEANRRDWCSEYDNLVERWNGEFETMSLRPRKTDYEVEVTVTAQWTVTVTVSAESESDASEMVSENYTPYEMVVAAGDSIHTPDSTDFEIEGVSPA